MVDLWRIVPIFNLPSRSESALQAHNQVLGPIPEDQLKSIEGVVIQTSDQCPTQEREGVDAHLTLEDANASHVFGLYPQKTEEFLVKGKWRRQSPCEPDVPAAHTADEQNQSVSSSVLINRVKDAPGDHSGRVDDAPALHLIVCPLGPRHTLLLPQFRPTPAGRAEG
ncbi:hypothetical protein INR49_005130 [Caranx melampygus]|nr:hypothetical protein INR49_005130 [Caranx melampygus]